VIFSHSLSSGPIACQRLLYPLSVAKWTGYKHVLQCLSAEGGARFAAATVMLTGQLPSLHPVRLFADRAAALPCEGALYDCCQFAGRMRRTFCWCCNEALHLAPARAVVRGRKVPIVERLDCRQPAPFLASHVTTKQWLSRRHTVILSTTNVAFGSGARRDLGR